MATELKDIIVGAELWFMVPWFNFKAEFEIAKELLDSYNTTTE